MKEINLKDVRPDLYTDDKERFIKSLPHEDLRVFVKECLTHADYELTDKDLKLCQLICEVGFERMKIREDGAYSGIIIDELIAAMLRNTYFDRVRPVTSLFKAREEFWAIGKDDSLYTEGEFNDKILEGIFQCIEGQMGVHTPIAFNSPVQGSPQDDFALYCFLVDKGLVK